MTHKPNSKDYVETVMEDCGYNYYMPWGLFEDLVKLHICNGLRRPISDINILPKFIPEGKKEYYLKLQGLYASLDYDDYVGHTPVHKAFDTLKRLSETINFRSAEDQEEDFLEPTENYVEVIESEDKEILVKNSDTLNSEEIAKIIKLSCKVRTSLPKKSEDTIVKKVNSKMKSYSDLKKSRRSSMIRPDFKQKFAGLKLVVSSKTSESSNEDAFIYLEDASSSMIDNKGLIISKAIQLALLKDPRPVHYYRYAGQSTESYILNTKEEKIKCFSAKKKYKPYNCDYNSLIDLMNKVYNRGNVIISTDGNDYVPKNKSTKLVYNCVGIKSNIEMRSFVLSTGGKYFTV
tara:strand:- start:3314 stop:4354 length:1041 start_codon:yes stop_codon:yes gene_type:complete